MSTCRALIPKVTSAKNFLTSVEVELLSLLNLVLFFFLIEKETSEKLAFFLFFLLPSDIFILFSVDRICGWLVRLYPDQDKQRCNYKLTTCAPLLTAMGRSTAMLRLRMKSTFLPRFLLNVSELLRGLVQRGARDSLVPFTRSMSYCPRWEESNAKLFCGRLALPEAVWTCHQPQYMSSPIPVEAWFVEVSSPLHSFLCKTLMQLPLTQEMRKIRWIPSTWCNAGKQRWFMIVYTSNTGDMLGFLLWTAHPWNDL